MCGAQRSKHTHERGVEKCLALIKTTPEVFADAPTEEGGFFEHVMRVLVAKKRDARASSGASPSSRASAPARCWRATTSRATSRGGRCSGSPGLRRRGQDGKRARFGGHRARLWRLIGEDGAEVDEQVWTALSDAVVPRVHDKVAGVRRAACLALRRLQEDNQPATHALGRALARDSSAEVRAAAARALDPSKKTVGLLWIGAATSTRP